MGRKHQHQLKTAHENVHAVSATEMNVNFAQRNLTVVSINVDKKMSIVHRANKTQTDSPESDFKDDVLTASIYGSENLSDNESESGK